ncbi:MAG: anti-sigma factor antagonist [Clostridia bacterium]
MEVISKREADKTVIYLLGELDNHNSAYARSKMDALLEDVGTNIVIFDLKLLSFMDSTGIGVLIGRYKKMKDTLQMFVRNPNKTIDKIFQMAGLYQVFSKV